ncbi:MAG TPA: hypothetical protein VMS17_07715 [Gemmataceae bacterium]|nr:hypothetical protein [Gemmataceae bacterium]
MSGTLARDSRRAFRRCAAGAVVCAALFAGASRAQLPPAPVSVPPTLAATPAQADGGVVQAGCAACQGGVLGLPPSDLGEISGCSSCGCGSNGCVPGRKPCDCCCDATDGPGRFFCGIYQCICCPDPCYEPQWNALADQAFGQTSGPRPVTEMRLKFEEGFDMKFPDLAEFFMPQSNTKGPKLTQPVLDANLATYREFHLINEAAIGKFSAWIDLPYENVSFENYNGAAGLGDLSIGTKSMLLDCELLQFTFEFNTYTPTGNFTRGLGTGHVSLEPGFLMALKLAPETYLQGEIAYRFPLGGDQAFEGAVFEYHASLNHLLWCCGHDLKLVGAAELNGWQFLGGEFTATGSTPAAALSAPVSSSPFASVLNIGPSARLVICDKIDFGLAGFFNLSDGSLGNEILEAEFRWRF